MYDFLGIVSKLEWSNLLRSVYLMWPFSLNQTSIVELNTPGLVVDQNDTCHCESGLCA